MNCDRVILEASNYIDGEVDAAVKLEIEQHLEQCEGCTTIVVQMKLTVAIFVHTEPVELPQEVHSRLHRALRRRMGERGS